MCLPGRSLTFREFASFPNGNMCIGFPVLMKIIMMPIELLGIFIKPFSLLIRLYANMHVPILCFWNNLEKYSNGRDRDGTKWGVILPITKVLMTEVKLQLFPKAFQWHKPRKYSKPTRLKSSPVANGEFGSHFGNGITRCLTCQCRRTRNPWINFNGNNIFFIV